jgi:hypothetical protein
MYNRVHRGWKIPEGPESKKCLRSGESNFKPKIMKTQIHLLQPIAAAIAVYPIMKSHVVLVIRSIGQDWSGAEFLRAPTGDQLTYFIVSGGQIGRRRLL